MLNCASNNHTKELDSLKANLKGSLAKPLAPSAKTLINHTLRFVTLEDLLKKMFKFIFFGIVSNNRV